MLEREDVKGKIGISGYRTPAWNIHSLSAFKSLANVIRIRMEPTTGQTNGGVESTPRDVLCRAKTEPSPLHAARVGNETRQINNAYR
jgi:hypothetical protein